MPLPLPPRYTLGPSQHPWPHHRSLPYKPIQTIPPAYTALPCICREILLSFKALLTHHLLWEALPARPAESAALMVGQVGLGVPQSLL